MTVRMNAYPSMEVIANALQERAAKHPPGIKRNALEIRAKIFQCWEPSGFGLKDVTKGQTKNWKGKVIAYLSNVLACCTYPCYGCCGRKKTNAVVPLDNAEPVLPAGR
jgi:hypothetical protein